MFEYETGECICHVMEWQTVDSFLCFSRKDPSRPKQTKAEEEV
jgi:hypothetical protein